jgi:hypothetical protein
MTVKRRKDPAGLLGDHVSVDLRDGATRADMEAVLEILKYNSPGARIARLRKHPELVERANRLEAQLVNGSAEIIVNGKRKLNRRLMEELAAAERDALYLAAAPAAIRDRKRQAGTRKPRGPRNPEVDSWIDAQLKNRPDATAPDLYERAPSWLSAMVRRERFAKRVTAARKRRRSPNN